MRIDPLSQDVPEWVDELLYRTCFDWCIVAPKTCQGLKHPHLMFTTEGLARIEFDGPLWLGIHIIDSIEESLS